MERIVCNIQMGKLYQDVYIINDNNKIQNFTVPLEKIPDFIIEHNIYNVTLKGIKDFSKNIEKDTKEKEIKKYAQNKINFYYI